MPHFRIVFLGREILSCTETEQHPAVDELHTQHKVGKFAFVLVHADDEDAAREEALKLVDRN